MIRLSGLLFINNSIIKYKSMTIKYKDNTFEIIHIGDFL